MRRIASANFHVLEDDLEDDDGGRQLTADREEMKSLQLVGWSNLTIANDSAYHMDNNLLLLWQRQRCSVACNFLDDMIPDIDISNDPNTFFKQLTTDGGVKVCDLISILTNKKLKNVHSKSSRKRSINTHHQALQNFTVYVQANA